MMPSEWIANRAWIDSPAGREEQQKMLSAVRIAKRAGERQTQDGFALAPGPA